MSRLKCEFLKFRILEILTFHPCNARNLRQYIRVILLGKVSCLELLHILLDNIWLAMLQFGINEEVIGKQKQKAIEWG